MTSLLTPHIKRNIFLYCEVYCIVVEPALMLYSTLPTFCQYFYYNLFFPLKVPNLAMKTALG